MKLKGKTILMGITGGIAAYKAAQLASDLIKQGAEVHVLMTKNAIEFVTPTTFETLTANRVSVDTFDRNFQWNVQHVALAKKASLFIVVPATANIIAKMAMGIADDMLSTTILACSCPKIVAPAMNTGMYNNPATQRNLAMLLEMGVQIVDADSGWLACGDVGKGRLAELPKLMDAIIYTLAEPKDMGGMKVLVTAGPTREAIDPVRFISNHSTGKMGYELAKAARLRGAEVTLVSGPTALQDPAGIELIKIESAAQMAEAVFSRGDKMDIIIKTAAVADYRPAVVSDDKLKKSDGELSIALVRNPDILKALGERKRGGQILCGFSMETKDLLENSKKKLKGKNADMIVANNLKTEGAGFGADTNVVTVITDAGTEELPKMTKEALSDELLTRLLAMYIKANGAK